jgi:translation initiation factor IF-1
MIEKDPRERDERAMTARQGSGSSRDGRGMTVEGIVRESLPYAQYRVEIDGPRQITAHAPSAPGKNFIRVLIGDRVRLELSPRDVTRGRIVQKL